MKNQIKTIDSKDSYPVKLANGDSLARWDSITVLSADGSVLTRGRVEDFVLIDGTDENVEVYFYTNFESFFF